MCQIVIHGSDLKNADLLFKIAWMRGYFLAALKYLA